MTKRNSIPEITLAGHLEETLLLTALCLHLLILSPILNKSSYLIPKSLMLQMLGLQPLFSGIQ